MCSAVPRHYIETSRGSGDVRTYIQLIMIDVYIQFCFICHLDSLHTTSVSTEAPSELVSEYIHINYTITKESCTYMGRGV